MFKKFLKGVASAASADAIDQAATQLEGELPCIGRKSDLIPVNSEIGRIVPFRLGNLDTYKKIAAQVRETLPYDRLVITILDLTQNTFRNAFVLGPVLDGIGQGDVIALRDSFVSDVVSSRRALRLHPSAQYPDRISFADLELISRVATPLITNDEIIGTLHLS